VGAARNGFSDRAALVSGIASIAIGVLIAAGQAPVSQPVFAVIGLFLLASRFASVATARAAATIGWLGGVGYFAASLHWIVEPFLVDAPRFGWMAPFALLFVATGFALFWAAGFWLAQRIGGKTRAGRLLALVCTLGLAELARSYVLTGFPWGLIAYVWIDTPLAQLAAYVGPHGLGVLTMVIAVLPLLGGRRRSAVFTALAAAVFLTAFGLGTLRENQPVTLAANETNLRLVQPNAPQHLKWRADMIPVFYERLLSLSRQPAETAPDLIIWPEAAVAFWLDNNPVQQKIIGQSANGTGQVILGMRRFEGQNVFNSMTVLDNEGVSGPVYDKSHLVPFGEYMPLGNLMSRFGLQALATINGPGLSAGDKSLLFDLGASGKVLPLICYEAIFPQLSRSSERPDWILQITNDAWFGEFAGPFQHLVQARFRAVEQGLPLVRSANTGVSAVIDANGRITASLPLGQAGIVDARLPAPLPRTVYSRTGDGPWGLFLTVVIAAILTHRRVYQSV